MDVSETSGTPKSSILIGFSIINHPFWGTTILGTPQVGYKPFTNHWSYLPGTSKWQPATWIQGIPMLLTYASKSWIMVLARLGDWCLKVCFFHVGLDWLPKMSLSGTFRDGVSMIKSYDFLRLTYPKRNKWPFMLWIPFKSVQLRIC